MFWDLRELSFEVKKQIEKGAYEEAHRLIADAMRDYPDSGVPHNLMGILAECQWDHVGAMKHFRAAWALEPTFLPARWNMDRYGSTERTNGFAYVAEDVPQGEQGAGYKVVYDDNGVGHMIRRREKL